MRIRADRIGEKHITKEGYETVIVEYYNVDNCTILLNDKIIIKNRQYWEIVRGGIKNPLHKSVYGVGYVGIGKYKTEINKKEYITWSSVMCRCYSSKYHEKRPTYKNITVCEEWYNFQNFAKWFEENYKEGFVLDKDILVKGNNTYSSETCCFIPSEINSVFTKSNKARGEYPIGVHKKGNKFIAQISKTKKVRQRLGSYDTPEQAFQAYKTAKEAYIKEIADKWKRFIDPRVYQAMYNYRVEITD